MSLGCCPEPTWWEERPDSHRLSSDLHTGAVACIVSLSPPPQNKQQQKSESEILEGKENSARLQICLQLCIWLSAPDKTVGPREQ